MDSMVSQLGTLSSYEVQRKVPIPKLQKVVYIWRDDLKLDYESNADC